MSPTPQPFAPDTYARWHKAQYPADDPLLDKVEKLLADLVAGSRDQLTVLAQSLLVQSTTRATNTSRRRRLPRTTTSRCRMP